MFIATESLKVKGEGGEQVVWEAIQSMFQGRKCLGYWRYPIFSFSKKFRKEPDILIADFELGLIIIEVKSISIKQIVNIQGHRWQYSGFYQKFGNPYQQGENQLFALLEYINQEPCLEKKVWGKVLVALPFITEEEWQKKGFNQLPSCPPILFKNQLSSSLKLKQIIKETPSVLSGQRLKEKQWEQLLKVLSGTSVLTKDSHKVLTRHPNRGQMIQQLRKYHYHFDVQQEKIGKEIPPGCQRIMGIAGSGKTILLCQKAAIMHLKYPQWKIAFIFFSRSLYEEIIQQIDRWIRYFSHQQKHYQKNNRQLQVLHAWGSREQLGFYRLLCQRTGVLPLSVNLTNYQSPHEALGEVCVDLLKQKNIPQLFDAILIDEGQDLMVKSWHYQGKQPFYWLAYQSLRPVDPISPQQKRLIWAYDQWQLLENINIPPISEIFGQELGHLVTGKYSNNINKTERLNRCYRTPHQLITVAHSLAMGWLRPQGMLTGMKTKEDWSSMGYEVEGSLIEGEKITIKRPDYNSPHPLASLAKDSLIEFNTYLSRQEEISVLAKKIQQNLRHDGLRPSKEILVIILGEYFQAMKLQKILAKFLIKQGIDIFLPGSESCNLVEEKSYRSHQFWYEGAVTLSRIYRAKGLEADVVYILGLEHIAQREDNLSLRNQIFIAITRSRGWVELSGIGNYAFYQELKAVINHKEPVTLTYKPPQKREILGTDVSEFLHRYRLGERNFQQVDLSDTVLNNLNLSDVNLIGANLSGSSLQQSQLNRAKLISADLSYANLEGANLTKAKLMGANLMGANLTNTIFHQADLSGAILEDTIE